MSKQLQKLLGQLKGHKVKSTRTPLNKRGTLTELEKRISTSPYAAMLGSSLRLCGFHGRIFPSKLLLRFGIGWHPDTNQLWAYITPGKRHEYSGRGYYITLSQYILGSIKDSDYRRIFRHDSNVIYRSDMTNHAKTELIEEAYKSFCKYPLDSLELLTSIPDNDKEYQCILLLSPNPESPFLTLHQATSDKHIPVYDVSSVWSHHNIESKFKVDTVALGVPRDKASVDLAVSLWRCHLYLKNKSMST